MTHDDNTIVIASNDYERCLFVIAKKAMDNDELTLNFIDKYAPTAEYLIRILRKGFGWIEQDRGTTESINTRCLFNVENICTYADMPQKPKCTESIKVSCKAYKKKYDKGFIVNYITIEKAGGIRGL